MGCDIHLRTERNRTINDKKKWVNVDHWKYNCYFGDDDYEPQLNVVEIYNARDYRLFSTLADVRNNDGNPTICKPKGLPEDCSEIVLSESEQWGSDGHSHSYHTLEDLKLFREDNKIIKYSGMMDLKNAEKVDKGEMPDSWCAGTNIDSYVYREWEHETDILKYIIEAIEERKREEFWIWDKEEHAEFDKDIRIVFWFDN